MFWLLIWFSFVLFCLVFFFESMYLSLKMWLQEEDWKVAQSDFLSYRSGPEHIYPITAGKLAHSSTLRVDAGLVLKLFSRLSFWTPSPVLSSGCSVPARLSPISPKRRLRGCSSKTEQRSSNQLTNTLWHLKNSKPVFPFLLKITTLNWRTWFEVHGGG